MAVALTFTFMNYSSNNDPQKVAERFMMALKIGNVDKIDPNIFEEVTAALMPYRDTPLFPVERKLSHASYSIESH